jgi:hypothetical protein
MPLLFVPFKPNLTHSITNCTLCSFTPTKPINRSTEKLNALVLHNKPKAEVLHPGRKLTGSKEEECAGSVHAKL